MRSLVALLATAACLSLVQACGGAEPDAPRAREVSLTLDFRPNAVHTALYAAEGSGAFDANRIEMGIRQPGSSSDSAKLLASGRTDLAIMDIADLALARSKGAPLIAIGEIVRTPLAAVIIGPGETGRPRDDLSGATVGVTGVPSDDLVLETVLRAQGLTPSEVRRVSVGYGAIGALSAGRLDAATSFWNSEGVELRRAGVPTIELRVDRFGAPVYPQLLLVAREDDLRADPELACSVLSGLAAGNRLTLSQPDRALSFLLDSNPALDRDAQDAELRALLDASAIPRSGRPDRQAVTGWIEWAAAGGLLDSDPQDLTRGMLGAAPPACPQSP